MFGQINNFMKEELKNKIKKHVDEKYNGSLKNLRDTNLHKFLAPDDIKLIRDTVALELQDKASLMIFCFLNDIYEQPKCPCGNDVEFDQVRKRFRPFCSVKCQRTFYSGTVAKRTNTNMEKYGSGTYMSSKLSR